MHIPYAENINKNININRKVETKGKMNIINNRKK